MNKSISPDGFHRYRVSSLKVKLDRKRKMLMLNICSFRTPLRTFAIIFGIDLYLFLNGPQSEKKTGSENLKQSQPVYFMILNFGYGTQLLIRPLYRPTFLSRPIAVCL